MSPSSPSPATPNYKPHLILSGHNKSISSVKFSPDGNLLASAGVSLLAYLFTYLQTVQASRGQVDQNMGRYDWGYHPDIIGALRGHL